jgi:CheY-like chemotaxis protein
VILPVPAFAQDDPRWSDIRLGPSTDTLGDEGCAVTSAAMVAAFYGIKTDPQQLNAFLTRTGGFTGDGLIHWSRVPLIAPARLELVYNGAPSYELIDSNLLAGNPVIVLIKLPGSLLSAVGLQIVLFESPRLFLEHARDHPVSLVIVDVWMPVLNGLEVQRLLRDIAPGVPVIMMTGSEDPGLETIALALGAIAFLIKPFPDTALLEAIRRVLPE